MKKTIATTFVVTALALTSACGGGEGRPSKSEVEKALTDKDSVFGGAIPKAAAGCVADALLSSGLSDKTLNAIVDGDKDYEGSKDDEKALESIGDDVTKCASS